MDVCASALWIVPLSKRAKGIPENRIRKSRKSHPLSVVTVRCGTPELEAHGRGQDSGDLAGLNRSLVKPVWCVLNLFSLDLYG